MGKKLYKALFNLPEFICGVLLSAIIILNLVGVVMRYIVGDPLTWGEEATLGLYVWMVMVGSSCVIKRNASIKLDFLVAKMPGTARKVIRIIVAVAAFAFFVVLAKCALDLGNITRNRTAIFKVHYFWIYLSIAVGAVFNLWFLTLRVVKIVKGENMDLSWSPELEKEKEELMASMYETEELKSEVNN